MKFFNIVEEALCAILNEHDEKNFLTQCVCFVYD